jgi:hypothetical protein
MHCRNTAAALAAAVLSLTTGVAAAEAPAPFLVIGEGHRPCSSFVEALDAERRGPSGAVTSPQFHSLREWMDGFLSGANAFDPDHRGVAEKGGGRVASAANMTFLAKWCREHPTREIADSVLALRASMIERGIEAAPPR